MMNINAYVCFLSIMCCNVQAMIPQAIELQKNRPYKLSSERKKNFGLRDFKEIDSCSSLQQKLKKAEFRNNIPTDQNYFKNFVTYIDCLKSDPKNQENLTLAQQYTNELGIRTKLATAETITSEPQRKAEKTSYFSTHKLLNKYWELEQQDHIPMLNQTMYNPDKLSRNVLILTKLHMPLYWLWTDTHESKNQWNGDKLNNLSIDSFKKDIERNFRKISFYRSILQIMSTLNIQIPELQERFFKLHITDFINDVDKYIEHSNFTDIKALTNLFENKKFQSLFHNWSQGNSEEDKGKQELIATYEKIKQKIATFPEIYKQETPFLDKPKSNEPKMKEPLPDPITPQDPAPRLSTSPQLDEEKENIEPEYQEPISPSLPVEGTLEYLLSQQPSQILPAIPEEQGRELTVKLKVKNTTIYNAVKSKIGAFFNWLGSWRFGG